MTRTASALLFAFLIGCSGNSDSKKGFAKAVEEDQQAEKIPPVSVAKPAATDTAAEAALQALLNAHTKGNAALADALKTMVVKREGEMNAGGALGMQPATSQDRIRWPDRYRAEWAVSGRPAMTMAFDGGKSWQFCTQLGDKPTPINPGLLPVVEADRDAILMGLLLPLLEKDRVAMPVPAADLPPGHSGVRVWVKAMTPMVLGVDAKSGLLTRVWFEKTEYGITSPWRYVLKDHKEAGGVLLPTKIVHSAGATQGAEWSKIEYEFPKTIDAALFEKP